MTADGDSRDVQGRSPGRNRRKRELTATDGSNAAVEGRRLRTALRQARQKAGLTRDEVAAVLGVSPSKIVRVENGAVRVSISDVLAMLNMYQITDENRVDEFVSMARAAAKQPPWWANYREFVGKRYLEYVELEQAAAATMNFQPELVPGLLQTRSYASAIIRRLDPDVTEEKANRRLELRMARKKELLDGPEPPRLSFVLAEPVVHWQVGSGEAWEEQIRHLIELAQRPTISIHVFRFLSGIMRGMQAPFVIVSFPDPEDPDALFLEGLTGDTLVVSNQSEVSRYRSIYEELEQTSLSDTDSVKFLEALLRDRR
jgi:transcriptional regulator with XRE-family HTH domain